MTWMNRTAALIAVSIGLSGTFAAAPAHAQECFIGEVRMFAGNFAPRGWALTDGQLLPISQNTALFSILGTQYGGDGRTTFGLPDLRGRHAKHVGSGPGLSRLNLGDKGGRERVTLSPNELPPHTHLLFASAGDGDKSDPSGNLLADDRNDRIYTTGGETEAMATNAIGNTGSGQPIDIRPPFQGINHIICLTGIFPSRS